MAGRTVTPASFCSRCRPRLPRAAKEAPRVGCSRATAKQAKQAPVLDGRALRSYPRRSGSRKALAEAEDDDSASDGEVCKCSRLPSLTSFSMFSENAREQGHRQGLVQRRTDDFGSPRDTAERSNEQFVQRCTCGALLQTATTAR